MSPPMALWVVLRFYAFAWPHLAVLFARTWHDSKEAEVICLQLDSLFFGIAAALVSFRLPPTGGLLIGILTSCASVGRCRCSGAAWFALRHRRNNHRRLYELQFLDPLAAAPTTISLLTLLLFQLCSASRPIATRNFVVLRRKAGNRPITSANKNRALEEARKTELAMAQVDAANRAGRSSWPTWPRAAHADERDHRLRTDARRNLRPDHAEDARHPPARRAQRPASAGPDRQVLDLSRSRPDGSSSRRASSRCPTWRAPPYRRWKAWRAKGLKLYVTAPPKLPIAYGEERRLSGWCRTWWATRSGSRTPEVSAGRVRKAWHLPSRCATRVGHRPTTSSACSREFQQADTSLTRERAAPELEPGGRAAHRRPARRQPGRHRRPAWLDLYLHLAGRAACGSAASDA
ncbi:MAG: hypothetical protein IPI73_07535 [Betaproteobacteria bacterium]|nr:hypothetical protein [Betaproteobacteria bacterium]